MSLRQPTAIRGNLMQPRAIGLLQLDITGPNRHRDEQVIGTLAHQRGYEFVGILTIRSDTYMPTTLVVQTACKAGAIAILTPHFGHFGGHARAIALACDLVTPDGTLPRSIRNR
ncbi:hypothetical protein [Nocardia sp. NBC_01009]|uniref:hypothetical protein n=1 Tax=Nocardia sp. NBC_01009 TaxID=2975996 RepID=UPI003866DFDC|nr:hypothetical protein OHA42_25025 [Nocardia sp. NBC_01009]